MDLEISVIIPVFNDPQGVEQTLEDLLDQDFPTNLFEILVVDNGSDDFTLKTANSIQSKYPNIITVLQENEIRGSYAARNKGLFTSRGKIICFIDANVQFDNSFLREIYLFFKRQTVDYLGCNVEVHSSHNTLTSKYQKGRGFNVKWYITNRKFAPTCCLAIKRSVVDHVGPFDPRLESGGDWEFGIRVHEAGFTQAFSDNIVVHHPARWRYRDLVKKNKRCARGEAQLVFYYPHRYNSINTFSSTIKRCLPSMPWVTSQAYRQKKVKIGFAESILLSFFHIPLNLIRFFSYRSELKRLLRSQ